MFGTVVEKSCIFLIDTSGSMDLHMDELKKELIRLVWEQLHKHSVRSARSWCLPPSSGFYLGLRVGWFVSVSVGGITKEVTDDVLFVKFFGMAQETVK